MSEEKKVAMTPIRAIIAYFEQDGGMKVTLTEIKTLTADDREELARLAAIELGVVIEAPAKG